MWNLDSPNMWKTIQGLNGTPDINSSNKTMSHDGQTITSIKSKVNVFIHHYARVVNLPCLHVDWDLNRQFKKRQNARSADDEICAPLQMGELLSAIKKIKCKGAAGLDNILPSFGPPGLTIHIQLILFTCSLSKYLEGRDSRSTTESWEISQWSCIFLLHQQKYFRQTFGTHSCWFFLLHCRTKNLFSWFQASFC